MSFLSYTFGIGRLRLFSSLSFHVSAWINFSDVRCVPHGVFDFDFFCQHHSLGFFMVTQYAHIFVFTEFSSRLLWTDRFQAWGRKSVHSVFDIHCTWAMEEKSDALFCIAFVTQCALYVRIEWLSSRFDDNDVKATRLRDVLFLIRLFLVSINWWPFSLFYFLTVRPMSLTAVFIFDFRLIFLTFSLRSDYIVVRKLTVPMSANAAETKNFFFWFLLPSAF